VIRAALIALAMIACKREEPAPAPVPSVTAAPSAAPAFVQIRPGTHTLGDPFTTNAKLSYDLAVGATGDLVVELVDRVGGVADAGDPRSMASITRDIKPPRASLEVRFENNGVTIVVASGSGRSEDSWPIDKARRPTPSTRLKTDVLHDPVILASGKYQPIAGFAWSAPDAAVPDPLVVDEAATEPRWILRVQFRPKV
jgi:hypothetical protein